MTISNSWYCPLLGREIAEGLCLDINCQREGHFKPDELKDAQRATGKTIEEIGQICEECPNNPFKAECVGESWPWTAEIGSDPKRAGQPCIELLENLENRARIIKDNDGELQLQFFREMRRLFRLAG